jgi:hypothetical protein
MTIRIDFVFSYWIFAWFLLYYFKITSYNPFFALIIATIENTCLLFLMIYYKINISHIIQFIIINFFIKVLPLIYLWKSKIILRDIIATFIFFLFYLLWLKINNQKDIFQAQKDIYNSLIHGKSETPFMAFIESLRKYVVKDKKVYKTS